MGNAELRVKGTLTKAIKEVLGDFPNSVEPVVVLAAYLHSLVERYGLTDSQHLDPNEFEPPVLPLEARQFVDSFVDSANTESLRNSLYKAFVDLADDGSVRSVLNKSRALSPREVLLLAQVAWNLEHNDQRPLLPLLPDEIFEDGKRVTADIFAPSIRKDFATMHWTDRGNQKGVQGKSSGDSFRRQTAKLAVLAAQWFLDSHTKPAPTVGEAKMLDGPKPGIRTIVWASTTAHQMDDAGLPISAVQALADAFPPKSKGSPTDQILVGNFAEVGDHYQPRAFENEIDRLWGDSGDRRVWLRGGPGLGKTYAARKIMQEALRGLDAERHNLLIWVESADAVAVTRELARAAERLESGLKNSVAANAGDREDQLARGLLDHLRTADMRWLIVFDDANAAELIERKLVPPGTNPRGRVLITTLSASHRISGSGHQVEAELFSPGEAEEFLNTRLPETSVHDRAGLSDTVRHHPLALSIAASTIAANRMTVSDWVKEFHESPRMDEAADYSDAGGYPTLIGATWKVALDKAARGMPNGVVERTAMVAALQDPDGHPTWLWQRDSVCEWVAGETELPATRTRMHPGVKRLVDYGIIQITGSWQAGRLAIHQLAARAIREASAPEELALAGAVLAEQWLCELTSNPANAQHPNIRAAVGPIAALPKLNALTRSTATALVGFSAPSTNQTSIERDLWELELLEPHLVRGGAVGRADLAERLANIGRAQRELGRHSEAHNNLDAASSIYRDLAALADLNDNLRAKYLVSLADIDAEMDQPGPSLERRRKAAKLLKRYAARKSTSDAPISDRLALAEIYQNLSDDNESRAALDSALSLWESRPPAGAVEDRAAAEEASTLAKLGEQLAKAGRLTEAKSYLLQAARLNEKTKLGRLVRLERIHTRLAYVCSQLGEWREAEKWFERTECDPLLLASVQLHQGRVREAQANVDSSASRYSARSNQNPDRDDREVDSEIRELIKDELAFVLAKLTQTAMKHERWEDAAGLAEGGLEFTRAKSDASPGEDPIELSNAYRHAGLASLRAGRFQVAATHFASGANIAELLWQMSPADHKRRLEYGQSLYWVASSHARAGQPGAAVRPARRAVEVLEGLEGLDDEARFWLSAATSVLGRALLQKGDADEAVVFLTQRVQSCQASLAETPDDHDSMRTLGDALQELWKTLFAAGRWQDSIQPLRDTIAIYRAMSSGVRDQRRSMADIFFMLAYAHNQLLEHSEAAIAAEQSANVWQALADGDPSDNELQVSLAHALGLLGESLSALDRRNEAVQAITRAVGHLQLPAELNPDDHMQHLIHLLDRLGTYLHDLGLSVEAEETQARLDDLRRRFPKSAEDA